MKTIELVAPFRYMRSYIPHRCRKPKFEEAFDETLVEFRVASHNEAPLAFSHKDGFVDYEYTKEYRTFEGKLYTRSRMNDYFAHGEGWYPLSCILSKLENRFLIPGNVRDKQNRITSDRDLCVEGIQAEFEGYLLMETAESGDDYEVWEVASEPIYQVGTYGFGCNHGGTALFISSYFGAEQMERGCFNALQYDKAVEHALNVATGRGDTEYLDLIKAAERIAVYMPELVKAPPHMGG